MYLGSGWYEEIATERQEELLRKAAAYRLVRQAMDGVEGRPTLRRQAMSRLGDLLVASGRRLQTRYS